MKRWLQEHDFLVQVVVLILGAAAACGLFIIMVAIGLRIAS